jgi:hypothetical protein
MGAKYPEQIMDITTGPGIVDGGVVRTIAQEADQRKNNQKKQHDTNYFFANSSQPIIKSLYDFIRRDVAAPVDKKLIRPKQTSTVRKTYPLVLRRCQPVDG